MAIRPTIRGQVLVPVLAVQAAAVAVMAYVAATSAARRVESQVVERLDTVIATLARSSFPMTPAVLNAMRGLSGAHFVLTDARGEVRGTTLGPLASLPAVLPEVPRNDRLESPGQSPAIELGGDRYFAASVPIRSGSDQSPVLLVLYPEAAWSEAKWDAALPPIIVGIAALAVMALATGIVAHRLGTRLRRLERQTAAIAGGDFRPLDPGPRRDEVGDLAVSINRMSGRLSEMREAIRRTERAGVLAQLAAGLAHGLRNAATGARLAIQLHARRCPATADGSLDVALRQLALTEGQVKSLLALGRPERAEVAPVEAAEIIDATFALVEPTCHHAGVALGHSAPAGLVVHADGDSLRAAVLNLALNATEAAGPGGSVDLRAEGENGAVRFLVEDTGPGPPPDLAASLFDPFVTSKPEGVGLGLAVARQVALDHGGTIEWTRSEGRTRFALTIPRTGPGATP